MRNKVNTILTLGLVIVAGLFFLQAYGCGTAPTAPEEQALYFQDALTRALAENFAPDGPQSSVLDFHYMTAGGGTARAVIEVNNVEFIVSMIGYTAYERAMRGITAGDKYVITFNGLSCHATMTWTPWGWVFNCTCTEDGE